MTIVSKQQFQKDGFTVIVERALDENPDLSYLEQDYSDESVKDRSLYLAQDAKRLKDYRNGNWHMLGISVTIRKQTKTNWANGGLEVGRAFVGGFESDSEESYLKSQEKEITEEAFAEVELLKKALLG